MALIALRSKLVRVLHSCLPQVTIIPTIHDLISQPSRIPYDLVSQTVTRDRSAGIPAYTTWLYGIGDPVNYYCNTTCVAPLPADDKQLPSQIVLLFRPVSPPELQQYQQLQRDGFSRIEEHYYTNGSHSIYGTTVAILRRTSQLPATVIGPSLTSTSQTTARQSKGH
jgi:hypothetical protein